MRLIASLYRSVPGWIFAGALASALTLSSVSAATVTASFSSATSIPIIAAGYTATGNILDITLGFAPAVGTNLTVIKNTGIPFISGTFDNLPNGSTANLSYGGKIYPFVAWYYGGTGNDLVLLWPTVGLAAWGGNSSGQLGDNTLTQHTSPSAVDQTGVLAGKRIVQVSGGSAHTLALTSEGQVYAWGSNAYGQIGDGSATQRLTPVAVNTAAPSALSGKFVVAVSAGASHSLALCSDGSVAAWGANGTGALGDNSINNRTSPVAVNTGSGSSALSGKSVVALAAGTDHSLALCADGLVVGWGNNSSGQLGTGSGGYEIRPVAASTAAGFSALSGKLVVALAAGNTHSLALCSDGSVVSWGSNNGSLLGDGTTSPRRFPVAVSTAAGSSALSGKFVVALAAGYGHSLALCSDGSVAAWGVGLGGERGDGTSNFIQSYPVAVDTAAASSALSGKSVVTLAAGLRHSLALCSDGSLVAWGYNSSGAIGDGTTTTRLSPVAVNTTSGSSVLAGQTATLVGLDSMSSHSAALYALVPPEVATLNATGINPTGATLGATINPNGNTAAVGIEYDLTSAYGSVANLTLSPANGSVPQTLSTALSGLSSGTTYHFRVVASIFGGTIYSEDQTFQTTMSSPLADWKQAQFGADASNPAIADNLADPDADGMPNLLEYALRTGPLTASPVPFGPAQPVLLQPGDIPAHLLAFPYRPDATGLRYVIQRSPDLSVWTEIYRHNLDTGAITQAENVTGEESSTTQTLTVTDRSAGDKLFWRLVVETAPE